MKLLPRIAFFSFETKNSLMGNLDRYLSETECSMQEANVEVIKVEGMLQKCKSLLCRNVHGREALFNFYFREGLFVHRIFIIVTTFPNNKNKIVSGESQTTNFWFMPEQTFKKSIIRSVKMFKNLKM